MRYCFEGTKVLEYCGSVAASFAARMMSDWGAEVIKIEPPAGDALRSRGPFFGDDPHPERSCLFFYLNIGKLGVTLNLSTATGRELLGNLARQAHIVIEDQSPALVAKLGLDYPTLATINPGLVVVSLSPFGRTGPYSAYKAYPLTSYHAGGDGYILQCGEAYLDREPIKAGGFAGEYQTGLSVALAAAAARFFQNKNGVGQHVDVAQQEVLMALNRGFVNLYANRGICENRARHGYAYGGALPCQDGYVVIQATHDHMWRRLMELMGNPAWASDERFQTDATRSPYGAEINDHLRRWTSVHTKDELSRQGQRLGLPIAGFADTSEVATSAQLISRDFFVEIDHPVVGKVRSPFSPYVTSDTRSRPLLPPPLLGQHNEALLGCSVGDLQQMKSAGIV